MASDAPADAVLARIVQALDEAGVPYMLVGSFASTLYGAPRTTQDVDLVIAPTRRSLDELLAKFPEDAFYLSREAALQALASEGLFNVIDLESGWKIDFIVRKSRSFSREEFARRRETDLLGNRILVASAEDVVVSKLEWAKLSGSERQLRDVAGVLGSQKERLDLGYIERWVDRLDLRDAWEKVRASDPGASQNPQETK